MVIEGDDDEFSPSLFFSFSSSPLPPLTLFGFACVSLSLCFSVALYFFFSHLLPTISYVPRSVRHAMPFKHNGPQPFHERKWLRPRVISFF